MMLAELLAVGLPQQSRATDPIDGYVAHVLQYDQTRDLALEGIQHEVN
ncbi:MAG: hypothetical protein ACHQKY_10300 [Terriglobia bacterium]